MSKEELEQGFDVEIVDPAEERREFDADGNPIDDSEYDLEAISQVIG